MAVVEMNADFVLILNDELDFEGETHLTVVCLLNVCVALHYSDLSNS